MIITSFTFRKKWYKFTCDGCGTTFWRAPYRDRSEKHYCSHECSRHANFKGGRYIDKNGYVLIRAAQHPNTRSTFYVPEHRLVMEKHIGRYLDKNDK